MGWYSTSDGILPGDDALHEKVMEFNDSPLYLTLSTTLNLKMKELPLSLYESSVTVEEEKKKITFGKIRYNIETEPSELIGVKHVANADTVGVGSSSRMWSFCILITILPVVPQLSSMQNAIGMLLERVQVVVKYLELVKEGKVPQDIKLLRQISNIAHQLPAVDSPKFTGDFTNVILHTIYFIFLGGE